MNLLARASLRHALAHPGQLVASVVGVALGVAVVVGIDLASESARRAFGLSTEAVTGRTTHQVFGGAAGLADSCFTRLRVDAGVRPSAPIVEGYASTLGRPQRTLHLLGVDPFSETPFRAFLGDDPTHTVDVAALLTRPGAVVLAGATARALALAVGDSLPLAVGGAHRTATVVGLLDAASADGRRALDGLVLTDIATAQELLGSVGHLSRIDLVVPGGAPGESLLARARAVLPLDAEIVPAAARGIAIDRMTSAFRQNLTALGLLAFVCGAFLIFNTMTFSVVQRRPQIGRLRALGVTREQVFRSVVGEAAVVAVAGTAMGLALGVLLGRGLVVLVTRTVNDLYFVLTVREFILRPGPLAEGLALGLGGTLLAALAPAFEATSVPPVTVLARSSSETSLRRALPRVALAGAALLAVSAALLAWPTRSLFVSFGALFALVIGVALLTPGAVLLASRVATAPAGRLFGTLGRMAARGVAAGLSRTGIATAALLVAISVAVGVGIMITSFRETVVHWLEYSLQADVYVTGPSLVRSRSDVPLDPAVVDALTHAPGIVAASTLLATRVETADGPLRVLVTDLPRLGRHNLRFKSGDERSAWPAFETGGAVFVSEPYAWRRRVDVGARVRLRTPRGEVAFPVAGVYFDYGSDQGAVMLSRTTWARHFDDSRVTALGLFVAPGTDVDRLVGMLSARVPTGREVVIRSNQSLRRASLDVFDRTFVVTAVLRLLAFVVAFVGVWSALMALALEKSRELAVLRACGLTPGQMLGLVTLETGLLGGIAGALAIPVGVVLAAIMIFVINQRSFGWTLGMTVDPWLLAQALGISILAALLAGLYPALRMARTPPAIALREE